MGACQSSETNINKDQYNEDNHSTLVQGNKKSKAQSLKADNGDIIQADRQQQIEKAPELFKALNLQNYVTTKTVTELPKTKNVQPQQDGIVQTIREKLFQQGESQKQKYEDFQQLVQNQNGQWVDNDFPASFESLTAFPEKYAKGRNYIWLPAEQIEGLNGNDYNIFDQGITPQDIKQGALGDCYLLSSLAALAENSEQQLINRLFEFQTKQPHGIFGVWLCIMGEWQIVPLDNQFPCTQTRRPAYSKANGPELWVLLIEKAYAKVYGNYKKIEAGLTGNAIRDLTGAPYMYVNNDDVEKTWKLIDQYDNNFNMITAGSQSDSRGVETKQDTGIISGHAYSILGHAEVVNSKGQTCRIIQLRNPWGSHEWNGAFSDKSDDWTPELREKYNVTDANDGIFWMPIEDYCQAYAETTINFMFKDSLYSSYRVQTGGHKQWCIDFTVLENSNTVQSIKHFIAISQKSDRWFEDGDGQTDYSYSMVRLLILKKTETGYNYIGDVFKSDRDVDVGALNSAFSVGEYKAIVEIDWVSDYCHDFVISSYSPSKLEFTQAQKISNEEYLSYIDFGIREKITFDNLHTFRDGEDLYRVRAMMSGFLYFLYINHTKNLILQETGKMVNRKYLDIQQPHDNNELWEVDVRPEEKVIVKYRISEEAWGGYGYGMRYQSGIGSLGLGC